MHDANLLDTRLIPVERKTGSRDILTLPEVLEALSHDELESFMDLKAHQNAAIDMFFAHLGVLGVDIGADGKGIIASAEVWRERMLKIAPMECWQLWSPDTIVSCFMQPGMDQEEFQKTVENKGRIYSPDEIGVLIVSKNHTVKFSAMAAPSAWNWVASLIETQTLSGFDGRSLYGIPRMNGGLSTRFRVATYTDMSASGKWNSDVRKILDMLPDIYREFPHFSEDGLHIGATWASFWDGSEQIPTRNLHPLYVDVCRRIKLGLDEDGRMFAVTAGSSSTRVPHLDLKGVFGDPWAPLTNANYKENARKETSEAWTSLSPSAIPVRLLSNIVTGSEGVRQSMLQRFAKGDLGKPAFFCLSAILRGQGETYGYHDFVIPIPAHAVFKLSSRVELDALGARSRAMLSQASAADAALKFGVYRFCQPEKAEVDFVNSAKSEAMFAKASKQLRLAFSGAFFEHLWRSDDDEAGWIEFLKTEARVILEKVFESGGARSQLSFKAEAEGRSAFNARWRKLFTMEDSK
jgi:CRISPR system Cascade subunit CasA